jgi:hypothetical protein
MTYREERVVRVHDMSYTITISQRSKRAWVATGEFTGKDVEVVGSSANGAARRWVAAARSKGAGEAVNKRNREETGDAQG